MAKKRKKESRSNKNEVKNPCFECYPHEKKINVDCENCRHNNKSLSI